MSYFDQHVFVCENERDPSDPRGCCAARGAAEILNTFKTCFKESGLKGKKKIRFNRAGCLDRCSFGPVIVIYPEAVWYKVPDVAAAKEIFEEHVVKGNVVEKYRV